ncbi:MAG TPA: BamA/TamA family outer membrane protein, partial [Candidatus Krumholzibacteria bacterium]|nr:BamA/TamA family outer membrane protein [Candidatus Krumholzibacteria bacterium]
MAPAKHMPARPAQSLLRRLAPLALLLALGLGGAAAVARADDPAAAEPAHRLVLESVELEGATRTPLSTVLLYLPLVPGQDIDQGSLVAAVDSLKGSGLFPEVGFYTRPGSARGRLVLVLEVREHGMDVRWAAGNTDLDGWYLVPAMLALDNVSGHGERFDLQWRIGFRHSGALLNYLRPRAGDGRSYWGLRLSAVSTDWPWFADGVEYRHEVETDGLGGVWGRRVTDRWLWELGAQVQRVATDDASRAYTDNADGTIRIDDRIGPDQLPPGIRDGLGEDFRAMAHLDLQWDTRSAERRAGTPIAGAWGRLKTTGTAQGDRSHVGLQGDFRGYREVPGGVLALRLRGALVTSNAAFYDRLYLGGMYTVRGFPSHSLSAPGGDTWLWSGSLEHRSRILGDAKGTRLAGVFFLDAGAAGGFGSDAFPGVSAGVGYGVRMRVWWLDWI